MIRLSPNYDTITLTVITKESDSMREWLEPESVSRYRDLTQLGLIPVVGCSVSLYRVITGILDVALNIFKTREPNTVNQRVVGFKNTIRGILEIAPSAAFFGRNIGYFTLPVTPLLSQPVLLVAMVLIPHITAYIFSGSSQSGESDAVVSLSYDGICVNELRPQHYCGYGSERWIEELHKYGTWVRKDFV